MAASNVRNSRPERKLPAEAEAWRRLCFKMTCARHRVLLEKAVRRGASLAELEAMPWPS